MLAMSRPLTLPLLNKNSVLPAWHLGPRGTIRCLNEGHYIIDQLERSDWNFFLILPTMRLWDVGDYALGVGQACIDSQLTQALRFDPAAPFLIARQQSLADGLLESPLQNLMKRSVARFRRLFANLRHGGGHAGDVASAHLAATQQKFCFTGVASWPERNDTMPQ